VDTLFLKNGYDVQKRVCRGSTRTLYESIAIVTTFLSDLQLGVLKSYCTDPEEGEHFQQIVCEIAKRIEEMPITYEQDGQSDEAVAYLHYFKGASDWYVFEKAPTGGIHQAFGFAVINGDFENGELGYFNISELTAQRAELDLHFSPMTLDSVKSERRTRRATASVNDEEQKLTHARQKYAKGIEPVYFSGGAVVFAKGSYAAGFSGKKTKPDFAGDFVSEQIRRKAVLTWLIALCRKKQSDRAQHAAVSRSRRVREYAHG
jgi:hypothetical protein